MVAKPFHSVGKDRKAFLFLRLKEMVCIGAENIGHIGKLGQKRLEMEHVFAAADDLLIKVFLKPFRHLVFHHNQLVLISLQENRIPLYQIV